MRTAKDPERSHVRGLEAKYALRCARAGASDPDRDMLRRLRGRLAELDGQLPLRPVVDVDALLAVARERFPAVEWAVVDDRQSGRACLEGTETRPSGKRVRVLRYVDGEASVVVESARDLLRRAKPLEVSS